MSDIDYRNKKNSNQWLEKLIGLKRVMDKMVEKLEKK